MTNAQKYKEIFGFEPSQTDCVCDQCENCPIQREHNGTLDFLSCVDEFKCDWWDSEYKSPESEDKYYEMR